MLPRQQQPTVSSPPAAGFHASALRSRGYIHKPRHPVPSITLRELRKAYKQKRRSEPVANQELMSLLNALGENGEGAMKGEVFFLCA